MRLHPANLPNSDCREVKVRRAVSPHPNPVSTPARERQRNCAPQARNISL